MKLGFIGAGAVGQTLALALASCGYSVVAVSSHSSASVEGLVRRIAGCVALPEAQGVADRCDLVLITTPDEAIGPVAASVRWRQGQGVVHCSGATPLAVLRLAAEAGAAIAAFHPLQTITPPESADAAQAMMRDITFALEGKGWLLETLKGMAQKLGGRTVHLKSEDRVLYHAAATMGCLYVVALLRAAAELWIQMGVGPDEALEALLPMTRRTLQNLSGEGVSPAVTGPIARGDVTSIRRHLEAIQERAPRTLPLYCLLGLESLSLARDRVTPERIQQMEALLKEYLPAPG
ncbi:MAG: Rossmann-like and DUF2520 domain-containing protein [Dehalococcoidia bacterium]